jgi:hypothetical protein
LQKKTFKTVEGLCIPIFIQRNAAERLLQRQFDKPSARRDAWNLAVSERLTRKALRRVYDDKRVRRSAEPPCRQPT